MNDKELHFDDSFNRSFRTRSAEQVKIHFKP